MDEPTDQISVTPIDNHFDKLEVFFVAELCSHVLAFSLNFLLFLSLNVFSGFHIHMRIICRQMCFAFMVISVYGTLRSAFFIKDWGISRDMATETESTASCVYTWQIPPLICALLCFFPVLMVIERSIATTRFCYYEYTDNRLFYKVLCYLVVKIKFEITLLIQYAPLPFYILHVMNRTVWDRKNQIECELAEQNMPVLLRNAGQILIAIFCFICALYFKRLINQNAETKKEYIEYNYSSLSHRYQMHENAITCSLMYKSLAFISAISVVPLFLGMLLFNVNSSVSERMVQSAIWYLPQPLMNVFFPCYFIYSDSKLTRRILSIFKNCPMGKPKIPGFIVATA